MPDQTQFTFSDGGSQPSAPPPSPKPGDEVTVRAASRLGRKRPLWAKIFGRLMAPWVELKIEPDDVLSVSPDHRPIVYVLEDYGMSNALILERAARESGMPSPLVPLPHDPVGRKRAYLALSRRNIGGTLERAMEIATGNEHPKHGKNRSESLARLIAAHRADPTLDVLLVPVSIYVGRAPEKQKGWFSVLFSENWQLVGRFRRFLSLLLNGRDTLVRFSPPIELRTIADEGLPEAQTVRKLSRVLRTHFNRVRAAVVGPDLSTRRLLIDNVLSAPDVRSAIEDQARRDGSKVGEAWKKAHAYAWEIASDYSHTVVRSASLILQPVWSRIYRGLLVHHLEKLKAVAPGNEIIYVPCHRSHMDYLLISYLLFREGIVPPHIAAGINLNLPVVGTILRKGGAFFIRRSFRGNALYSDVFNEYVAQLVAGGYPIEYFIEGGRSRTGRLLQPKGGMISMTVRAYLRAPVRPVLFQPVYIGYEKLMEGNSYKDELSGKSKQKESIFGLISGIPKVLRSNYGQVVVNFGEPIRLNDVLAEHAKDWDGKPVAESDRPDWLSTTIAELSNQVMININRAADVNPINLLALALLSTPKNSMSETDLIDQIRLSQRLLQELPYSDRITVTPHTPEQIIAHGEEINVIVRVKHPLGDVLRIEDADKAIQLTYFRNNVLHLFTTVAWIASCFHHNRRLARATAVRLGKSMYPFLQQELFLPWTDEEFGERLERFLEVFIREGLLEQGESENGPVLYRGVGESDEVFRLRALGHPLQQAFERYYIAISILAKNGPGTLTATQLESLCHLAAQRLSLLYSPAAPEFFDKSLFRGFIQKLREMRLVWPDDQSRLLFDDRLKTWAKDAKVILGREMRHALEKVSPEHVAE
ncbi:glycerol-3-phosphate 1-O-acyltransferase PlsB [Lysobacter soyae]|uniref:Glycerol-3-phosphate acyltransferase n=2 Tax=Lysobacter soyae TaxID=2764185 RepID=A0ABX8WQU7_9GAMM|nr:glycerol-3-phosphate 1-O-acyltransferase PlsB [Lysobacter sp. CJ11]QYR53210.1 glycerol-3-phosphate 1-O-acyltransferase PlsB [Lysobacter sp. CJ11]